MNPLFAAAGITVTGPLMTGKILESTLAGSWFDANPRVLHRQIAEWVKRADTGKSGKKTIALIQPHAGYAYSGPTAAYGAKAVMGGRYSRVIILGPAHRVYMENRICIPSEADGMSTPLGTLAFDREALEKLRSLPFIATGDKILAQEHSVQIQLPFLQYALGNDFKLVPVVVGQLDDAHASKVADALKKITDSSTLVVVSSDFTHYGRNFDYVPFRTDIEANLKKLDLGAFDKIKTKNPSEFASYLRTTGATICGEAPIRILLNMLPGNAGVELLHYTTSSAESGDFSHCVSYISGAVCGQWDFLPRNGTEDFLSAQDKKTLLSMARRSIEYVFEHRKAPRSDIFKAEATDNMKKIAGCFVTLNLGNDLRGCIGEIEPVRPLYQAVTARAVDSAFRDPRFPQLSPAELKRVTIEISALTPAKPVTSYQDIVIGKHGMTITKDGRSAVFLPQVAPEQGWDLATTLTYLSRKAGLASDAWKSPDAKFTVFEAIVFHERK